MVVALERGVVTRVEGNGSGSDDALVATGDVFAVSVRVAAQDAVVGVGDEVDSPVETHVGSCRSVVRPPPGGR